jgi:glutathione S-transferase
MKLYWAPQTRSSRVVWMLEEAGLDYSLEAVDIRAAERRDSGEFRRASPMGKVPALVDGEVAMAESAAICLYVADRYCAGTLAPAADDAARGSFLYWMLFTPAVVEPAMAEKVNGVEPNPGRNGWGSFDLMLSTLETGLGDRPWLLGEEFSAADVMVGSSVVFMRMFGMLPESPGLHAYADRCLQRPAYQRALELEPA